jgi:hypothetical protein
MRRWLHPIRQPLRELLHLGLVTALALPALLGVLHRPPAMPVAAADSAMSRLWTDLASLCTPLGEQRQDDKRLPLTPMAACPLCVLLHGTGWALPGAAPRLPMPGPAIALVRPIAVLPSIAPQRPLRPPGRGPPAYSSTPTLNG